MLGLTFAAPLALAALIGLPALWFLLRVTPPRPRRIDFPPLKLVADLIPQRQNPARTPPWLLILRLLIAAALILAVAGPVWNAGGVGAGGGRSALLVLLDNGFPPPTTGATGCASPPTPWKAPPATAGRWR